MRRITTLFILFIFLFNCLLPSPGAWAQSLNLPAPGTMVLESPVYIPAMIKGIQIHADNPLLFDFILDTGKSGLTVDSMEFKAESQKLIKYFLAALTIKEDSLWVNLSPYEQNRIVAEELGATELGRDMLAQDYLLKQLTASLIYPGRKLGLEFWNRVYARAQEQFGTTEIPVDTFNKVWIVPDKAKVLERNNVAYVIGAHLKVMLEEDYVALEHQTALSRNGDADNQAHTVASQVVREIIIPEIEKEVNEGQHFAPLRQMFYAMILASWYKLALKDALLNQVYSDKGKTSGVLSDDPEVKEKIYARYLEAYRKGVFNYIQEEMDTATEQVVPRKYFSGGEVFRELPRILARTGTATTEEQSGMQSGDLAMLTVSMDKAQNIGRDLDAAMAKEKKKDAGSREAITKTIASLRQLYAMQNLNPVESNATNERILETVHQMVLNWYEVKSDRPLRYYRIGDLQVASAILQSPTGTAGMDVREDMNKTIAALGEQVTSKQLVDGSLIVTELVHPKDSDIKAFFAARNQAGGYELGFVRNNASPAEASVFVLTTGATSQDKIESLLIKLRDGSLKRKSDKKAGKDDYQDVKDNMVKAAGELASGAVHKIIATPETAYPALIRGYAALRGTKGYNLEITYNLGAGKTQRNILWEDMPLFDERIVNDILAALDTKEARAELEGWINKYQQNEQAGAEAEASLSDLVRRIVSNTLDGYTRYWFEEAPGGVRHYRGNVFFEQMPLTVMADVNVLPEGIKVDQGSELMRTFIDHLNDDLTADGYVPSSLILMPVAGQPGVKFIYAIRLGEQYRFGLVTDNFYDFVFLPVNTTDVNRVEGILSALNTPAITQQFADILQAGKADIDTASELTRVARAMPYERLREMAPEDQELGLLHPQKLLTSTLASPESLLRHFYAEPTAEGFSIGMAVQPAIQHRTLEYFTLSNKYLPLYPHTVQQILDTLEVKGRATIESLLLTHADVYELGAEVDKVVQGIVDEVLDKVEQESSVLRVEEYPGTTMPSDIVDNGGPSGRLFAVPLQRDVPTFVVAGRPILSGEAGAAVPLVLVQGVAAEIVEKTVATLTSRYSDRLKKMRNLEDREQQVLKGDIKRSVEELLKKNLAASAIKNASDENDLAMKAPGGIDLNAQNMSMEVDKDGKGVEVHFDPQLLVDFQKGDFTGLQGIILRIVPLQSPLTILGMDTARPETRPSQG